MEPTVDVLMGNGVVPTSFTIYTVPPGLKQKINVLISNVFFPNNSASLRIRIAGNIVREFIRDDGATPSVNESRGIFQSAEYILKGGDTVKVTTSNTGTAKEQSCKATVSITQSVTE